MRRQDRFERYLTPSTVRQLPIDVPIFVCLTPSERRSGRYNTALWYRLRGAERRKLREALRALWSREEA